MSVEKTHKIDTSKLDKIMASYDYKKSNLIAILQNVQEVFRYLPEDALIYIGTKMEGLSPAFFFAFSIAYLIASALSIIVINSPSAFLTPVTISSTILLGRETLMPL